MKSLNKLKYTWDFVDLKATSLYPFSISQSIGLISSGVVSLSFKSIFSDDRFFSSALTNRSTHKSLKYNINVCLAQTLSGNSGDMYYFAKHVTTFLLVSTYHLQRF